MFKTLTGFRVGTIAVLSSAMLLAACGPSVPAPEVIPPIQGFPEGQPQVAQQADGFDTGDAALGAVAGAAAGYMMGKGATNSQPQRTIIIDNRRPVNYGYSNGYGRKQVTTVTKTTTIKRGFGGTVTKTTRTTKRRR